MGSRKSKLEASAHQKHQMQTNNAKRGRKSRGLENLPHVHQHLIHFNRPLVTAKGLCINAYILREGHMSPTKHPPGQPQSCPFLGLSLWGTSKHMLCYTHDPPSPFI